MNSAIGLLVALAALGGAQASACTMIAPPVPGSESRRLELASATKAAEAAARPVLADRVAAAHDIFVARVAAMAPAPLTDIPKPFQNLLAQDDPRQPVRYRFAVERVIKGSPSPDVMFRPGGALAENFRDDAWMIAPTSLAISWTAPRSARDFWHDAQLEYGENEGGSGDCSVQWSFRPEQAYLVMRDGDGGFLAAEPLEDADPLADLVARLVATPSDPYPYRPDLATYLKAEGSLLRVRLTNCRRRQARVVEVIAQPRKPAGSVAAGETVNLYHVTPDPIVANCRRGAEYLLDGWPYASRLHPVRDGVVTFEDRWMQLRFTGPKTMPLALFRASVRP